MAEVMSMISDENSQGELNADEQESLQIGEEMEQQQETMLAGKYKNAEELEAAYIELQKKLGGQEKETPTEEATEEATEEEPVDSSLFDRLWEESQDEFSEDTLKELSEAKPEDLAKMYLEYRKDNQSKTLSEQDANQLRGLVGGDAQYKSMMEWASDNLEEQEISMYDSVMDSGDPSSAYFAVQALALRMQDGQGVEGKLLQGKAPSSTAKGYKSQAEVVTAMQDPRYDRDPAYRQEVMAKLEQSNVNF
tara:strand:+ start:2291 stop:3040 length:750 start_codon:yes stop_codon:yes gene_type:complete